MPLLGTGSDLIALEIWSYGAWGSFADYRSRGAADSELLRLLRAHPDWRYRLVDLNTGRVLGKYGTGSAG